MDLAGSFREPLALGFWDGFFVGPWFDLTIRSRRPRLTGTTTRHETGNCSLLILLFFPIHHGVAIRDTVWSKTQHNTTRGIGATDTGMTLAIIISISTGSKITTDLD